MHVLDKRINKVQLLLKEQQMDALLIDRPIDLYYLTGRDLSLGRLVICAEETLLFVDGRYFEGCLRLPEALSAFSVVLTSGYQPESAFGRWWRQKGAPLQRIGFDADVTPYSVYQELFTSLKGSELVALASPIQKLRQIKDAEEISHLQAAAALNHRGFEKLCSILQPGITERQAARALELFWLQEGAEKLGFAPHIAFGQASSQPHYQPQERPLKRGDLILIDVGVVADHYHSDMTRVVASGQPSAPLQEIYRIVYDAFHAALALAKPGSEIRSLDKAARDVIENAGYKDHFPHGLGHGVGLEIHELPRLRTTSSGSLQAGMVVTIEPGLYLPGVGGVRLENTILITETGALSLTTTPLPNSLLSIN